MPEHPNGRMIDRSGGPESGRKMEEECSTAFGRTYPSAGIVWVQRILARRDRGEVHEGLWEDPQGILGGYVVWEAVPSAGRRIVLWFLDEAHRSPESLRALFEALEYFEPRAGPVFVVPDALPGATEEEQSVVLGAAGMVHLLQERLIFPRGQEVPAALLAQAWRLRYPTPADAKEVLDVACRAYWDYPGQLLWVSVDLERDLTSSAVREGRHSVVPEATFVLQVRGRIRGNVVTCRDPTGPYIDSIQVDPHWQGRGLGRALLVRALGALREKSGPEDVRLTYLRQNEKGGRPLSLRGLRSSAGSRAPWERVLDASEDAAVGARSPCEREVPVTLREYPADGSRTGRGHTANRSEFERRCR